MIKIDPITETTKNKGTATLLKEENNSSPKIPKISGIKTKPINIFNILVYYILYFTFIGKYLQKVFSTYDFSARFSGNQLMNND